MRGRSRYIGSRGAAVAGAVLALCTVAAPVSAAPQPVKFAPAAHYANGATGAGGWSETSLVTADFNGDGRKDIVSTDYFNGKAPVLQLNLGGGTFQSPGTRLPAAAEGVGALAASTSTTTATRTPP